MANSWTNNSITSLTIPTGATTGERIVIDGTTGLISVYNQFGNLVDQIGGANGAIISFTTGHTTDIALQEGALLLGHADAGFAGAGSISGRLLPGGSIELDTGTGDSAHLDGAVALLLAGQDSQTTGSTTTPQLQLADVDASSPVDVLISGSLIGTSLSGTPNTWQTPVYGTGWAGDSAVGGVLQPLQYRLDAQNNLIFDGVMHTTSATPAAVAFTLPAGYRPLGKGRRFATLSNTGSLVPVYVTVGTNGQVSVTVNPGAANVDVMMEVALPLGQIP